jgi:hypothetical protein
MTGFYNTAVGVGSLSYNTIGRSNTALGFYALSVTSGNDNVAVGSNAGYNLTTGAGNVCIGAGVAGVADANNTTWIRNIYSSVANTRAVYVNSDGKLGTLASSRRFKQQIAPMDKASEAILALQPVTFRYKEDVDPTGAPQFGLVAEDVEKVDPDLVTRDEKGQIFTVRYEAVNAMLLNEFLKEHRKVEEQEATIAQLKQEMQAFAAQLKEQATQLRHVNTQIGLGKPAPQLVLNDQ